MVKWQNGKMGLGGRLSEAAALGVFVGAKGGTGLGADPQGIHALGVSGREDAQTIGDVGVGRFFLDDGL